MPLYSPAALVQSAAALLAGDNSTTSTTPVDLLSLTINTTGGGLCIWFTAGASATGAGETIQFTLLVDGVVVIGSNVRCSAAAISESVALVCKRFPTAGSHIVKVQWCIPTVGTAQILVSSAPNSDHGRLLVQEVNV